jgi:hypothetical protein
MCLQPGEIRPDAVSAVQRNPAGHGLNLRMGRTVEPIHRSVDPRTGIAIALLQAATILA